MFPPLLAALMALALPRARAKTLAVVALCLTGCGFAFIKFSWYGAELASAALTVVSGPSIVRADPADLSVLPALWLAWLAFRRASVRPVASHLARVAWPSHPRCSNRTASATRNRKQFESQALVVVAQPGGHVVLVSGRWTRIGWGTGTAPPALSQGVLPGSDSLFSIAAVVLLLLVAGFGVIAIRAGAPWRVSRFAVLFVSGAAVAICLDVLVTRWGDSAHPVFVIGAAAWSVIALGLGVHYAVRARWSLSPYWLLLRRVVQRSDAGSGAVAGRG